MASKVGGQVHPAPVAQVRPDTWAHIKAAFEYNQDLADRVLWCLGVDWQRTLLKFPGYSAPDRLFTVAFCWEWWAVAQYRLSHWAHRRKLPDLGRARLLQKLYFIQQGVLLRFCYVLGKLVEGLSGARLQPEADIGPGLLLMHTGSCGIGSGTRIGCNFTMYQDSNVVPNLNNQYPTIGDNVTLYSGARIVGAVSIGDGVRVGANAVVLHDLPPGCLALGLPARPVTAGAHPAPYPAWALTRDIVATLVQAGDLEQQAPGEYLDRRHGTVISLRFGGADYGQRTTDST